MAEKQQAAQAKAAAQKKAAAEKPAGAPNGMSEADIRKFGLDPTVYGYKPKK